MEEIAHSNTDALHFVAISRANPTPGRANPPIPAQILLQTILEHVIGHDHMRAIADIQVLERNTSRVEHRHFIKEDRRVQHDTAPDDICGRRLENAAWNEM